MSRLVTSSPTSGSTISRPASRSSRAAVAQTMNSSSYLVRPSPLRIAATRVSLFSGASARRPSTRTWARAAALGSGSPPIPGPPQLPNPSPNRPRCAPNNGPEAPGPRQPVNAPPGGSGRALPLPAEQRLGGPWHRPTVERGGEGAGAVVGVPGDAFDGVQVHALLGRGARGLEAGEVARDTPPLRPLGRRSTGHVIGDQHVARIDAFGRQPLDGLAEVHHVAGVVPGAEENAGTTVRGTPDGGGLSRGRRGEDVAHDRPVGETRTDDSAECGVMA